ncbi:MAG: CoA transferase, partial [Pseudomonadota bacterium]
AAAEEAAQAEGFLCIRWRSRAEWEAHPQRAALAAAPGVDFRPGPSGAAAPLRAPAGRAALSGLRVLDLSRIIAGPMGGRALAELGAEAIRVSAPDLPFVEGIVIDTGFGKRSAYADLNTAEGRETLAALVAEADVAIDGFRPGALAAKGFGREEMRALNPDLVHVSLSAFGEVGPWAGRRGYDTYVQAATGFAAAGPDGAPQRLACQPLDYLTGCLVAFAAVRGLSERAEGRGGASADLSLARTAMWLWETADAIGDDPAPPERNATWEKAREEGRLREMESVYGALAALAPPYGFEEIDALWRRPPGRLGADAPRWSA